jgi:hypothetical protein
MANHNRALDPEAGKGLRENGGLRFGRPDPIAWALAEPVARPVEGNHTMPLRDSAEHTAGNVVLSLDRIPVQQYDRWAALACFQVVEPDTACVDEGTGWWVLPLSALRICSHLKSRYAQNGSRSCNGNQRA